MLLFISKIKKIRLVIFAIMAIVINLNATSLKCFVILITSSVQTCKTPGFRALTLLQSKNQLQAEDRNRNGTEFRKVDDADVEAGQPC